MNPLTATLFFAALASAQTANITTTAWLTNFAGSDKYGYVASVVNADAQHMTLSLEGDSNAENDDLQLGGSMGNVTFGRGASSFTISQTRRIAGPTPTSDNYIQAACTRPAEKDGAATCNYVFGEGYARNGQCNEQFTRTGRILPANFTTTWPHTYGSGLWGGPGSEIISRTVAYPPQTRTTLPEWCTSDKVPASALSTSRTISAAEFAVYQIVIYAGQEKLSDFTADSTASTTASAGRSASTATGATQSAGPASTGAAGKMNVVLPAVAGMGVAAVMAAL